MLKVNPILLVNLNIALKEANETQYWLCLLKDTAILDEKMFQSLNADCSELVALLVSIIKSSKKING